METDFEFIASIVNIFWLIIILFEINRCVKRERVEVIETQHHDIEIDNLYENIRSMHQMTITIALHAAILEIEPRPTKKIKHRCVDKIIRRSIN